MIYRALLRPSLFAIAPETAHAIALSGLRCLMKSPLILRCARRLLLRTSTVLSSSAFGVRFPTPVGLAAGFDKDAEVFEACGALGFGFVEVGTITAQPQPGNPPPRLFRLSRDRALINRMGFNNHGAAVAAARINSVRTRTTPLGVNIGKTKLVPNEAAFDDYAQSATLLAPHADYIVINVSSPNTPALRDLQSIAALRPLLQRVRSALDAATPARRVPLLVKIAPDLSDDDIDALAALALELHLDGIIATNTTVTRRGLSSPPEMIAHCGEGGLSGAPLKSRSLAVLRRLRSTVGDRVTLIAVGGIDNATDAWDRICAGASLVQIYTAMIYDGPLLARRIAIGLEQRARKEGFATVSAAVGSERAG